MEAGKLRHRVELQTATEGRSTSGAVTRTWSPPASTVTVHAEIRDLAGREYFDAATVQSEVTTKIRIRYRSGIIPKMRAVWGSHIYDIESVVDPEGRQRELLLMAKEVR